MDIAPHNRISTKHKKCRSRAPRSGRTILNKREGRTLHQKTCNPWLVILGPLRTFGKQPSPTGVTPTMLLWVLYAQDSTHDLCNAKQMANKNNPYWKNRPGRSLPPDTRKRENRIDMNCNRITTIWGLDGRCSLLIALFSAATLSTDWYDLWFPLRIEYIQSIKNSGVVPLGVA